MAVLAPEERKRMRQERSCKLAVALHQRLTAERQKMPEGPTLEKRQLPTQAASRIDELLPHHWQPAMSP
ncbi:hypothetical protein [Variovorax sp. YR216]|uniref:hypothetical protein n=1 Tax=Variovorax sp. YR216 TaxID=1882828 RepID=UPI00159FE996|nr:hypothetical protein [Variovorax sp. YR216]